MTAQITDLAARIVRDPARIAHGDAMRLAAGILTLSSLLSEDRLADGEVRHAGLMVLSGNEATSDA